MTDRFQAFVTRAASCRPIFAAGPSEPGPSQTAGQKQVILLEDLPNILHLPTQEAFHTALEAIVNSASPPVAPLVIILSDAGLRGEASQDDWGSNTGWRSKGKDAVDVRTVLPSSLLVSPYVTQIRFVYSSTLLLYPAQLY